MKLSSVLLIAATALSFNTALAQGGMADLAIGSSIPKAEAMKSVSGDMISLDRMKTKNGLLVMFSCNTCPYVIKSQPRTIKMMGYAREKGIGMVIVNSNEAQRADADSYEAMVKYARAQGYTVPYVVDNQSKLANAFGASRTPEVFLFDKNGKLVYKGAMEDNPSDPVNSKEVYIKSAIDNMLADQPVNPNSTKSIGCSIKRAM
ncbi:MAG: thioredoxin family protein [Bacteroidetes bacterium]|nr:thioredoxin family protein [Bacteroidota bacterium]